APEVIEMHESPAMAVRRKKRSSIVVAMELVRDRRADAAVSAGHTGAAMGAALLRLGRIPGVDRPAIAAVLSTVASHPVVLLDVGANVDCRPHHLLQFAIMGTVYARQVLEIHTPHIGILSNGAEEGKGSDLTLRTTALLRDSGLDFIGNVESRDVFSGVADVVVCDGFVGNVVLKFGEGLALAIRDIVKAELRGLRGRLALLYLAPLAGKIRRMYRRIDYREYRSESGARPVGQPPLTVERQGDVMRGSTITGMGRYVPRRVMTNHELEKIVETTDEWIVSRTGIRERRIAAPEEASSDLAFHAAQEALADAGVSPEQIDLIIVGTATPDMLFPATACIVQDRLGARNAGAFDVSAACSSWVYAAAVAHGYIAGGLANTVLVVGAEVLSKFVNWKDRNTCVLFGDSAGAAVLRPCEQG